ncbi:hypothetical protein AQ611_09065 [Burkholderia singularis]|nr:hypothetical protein AQ611_09065 [Burkholderia sp. Bp7605]
MRGVRSRDKANVEHTRCAACHSGCGALFLGRREAKPRIVMARERPCAAQAAGVRADSITGLAARANGRFDACRNFGVDDRVRLAGTAVCR